MQPTLDGPTITLRPATSDDWAGLHAIGSDPLVWEQHPARDRWQEAAFRRYIDDGLASGGMLVAVDRAGGRIVGTSRFSTEFCLADEVEIGWTFVARDRWGTSTNREMKHLMLGHAFAHYATVIFRIGADNHRSRRAVEKIGAGLLDRPHVSLIDGREVPYVTYAIARSDFTGVLEVE
jgi:RimJ/RimL family protein N-acetyltransferase